MKPIVHIIDDDGDMRLALARFLRAEGHEVSMYASAGEFLLAIPSTPGCILLDLELPGPSGLDLQQSLQRHPSSLPIVFITGHGSISSGIHAMKRGAIDFLTKPVKPDVLLAAVEAALTRDRDARTARGQIESVAAREARLTPRERAVFREVVTGKLNKQIAGMLGIAERTVKMHRAQVMDKMGASSLVELVHLAEALGMAENSSPREPRRP